MGDHTFGKGLSNIFKVHYEGAIIFFTPIIFSPVMLMNNVTEYRCMYLLMIMAVYWIFEVIPLGMTSLLPVVFFPIMNITPTEKSCVLFFKDTLYMFITSILVAASIEYSNLHIRLALRVLQMVGCSPRRLHFGICTVSALLSMWITNAGVTAMMCPIIYAVLEQLSSQGLIKNYHDDDEALPKSERRPSDLGLCFYMSVAFASSIGGCGTLIGTPTNLAFKSIYDSRFPTATDTLEFGAFMVYALPIVIVINMLMYVGMEVYFMGLFRPNSETSKKLDIGKEGEEIGKKVINEKYAELGPLTTHELSVMVLFAILVFCYISRKPGFTKGWGELFDCTGIKNTVPTVAVLILLYMLPDNYQFLKFNTEASLREARGLLEWYFSNTKVPWSMVLVIGGGATLSDGSKSSGMANKLGKALSHLDVLPVSIILLVCVTIAIVMTNFGSNVAMCNIIVPVLAEMAVVIKIHPLFLIFPVGIACSMALMTPVGTPANAIIQAYAQFRTVDMIMAGFLPTVFTILSLWIMPQTWGYVVYPDMRGYPKWADEVSSGAKDKLLEFE